MGLDPIRYKPWNGQRSEHAKRFLVITDHVFRQKLRSKWLLGIIVLGSILVWVFPILIFSLSPHDSLTTEMMLETLQNDLLFIFVLIAASLVCADLISEDLRGNSLVLYLYRALRPERYLLGKVLGALLVMSLFTFIPPIALGIAVMATQTGPDYVASVEVIARTVLAAIFTTIFFLPVGMMLSSLTTKRTYAAVGIFMFFFTMTIVAGIFSESDINWQLLGPGNLLNYWYDVFFGEPLPEGLSSAGMAVMTFLLLVPPLIVTYWRILSKGVGK